MGTLDVTESSLSFRHVKSTQGIDEVSKKKKKKIKQTKNPKLLDKPRGTAEELSAHSTLRLLLPKTSPLLSLLKPHGH